MSSYLDQTPGFVFFVGIGYLHKSYDEHGLEKKGSLGEEKEKCPGNESFNWIWARATNSWRYESNWTFSIFESERIDQFIPSKLYVDCLCAYYLIPFACLPPPPSSPSFTDTTEDWRETSWVCSDFDVQMKMLGGVINK